MVSSAFPYSGGSTNGQISHNYEGEQEKTLDDSFCSSVSLWMKIRCKKMETASLSWRLRWPEILPSLAATVRFPLPANTEDKKHVSSNVLIFLHISSTFGNTNPNYHRNLTANFDLRPAHWGRWLAALGTPSCSPSLSCSSKGSGSPYCSWVPVLGLVVRNQFWAPAKATVAKLQQNNDPSSVF